VAWGRLGEICNQYLSKGRLVYIEGRLQTQRYEQQGETRYFTRVIAQTVQFLDSEVPDLEEEAPEEPTEEVE
jgi:single-strand DNA-binding protein